MEEGEVVELLDAEWEMPGGFLGDLRVGEFSPDGLARLEGILRSLEPDSQNQSIDKDLVRLTWFIPTYVSWNRSRVEERGGDVEALDAGMNRVINHLYRILGVP